MSEIQTLDGVLSGNVATLSYITSDLSTTHIIQGSLNKQNSETQVQLQKVDGEILGEITSLGNISSQISSTLSVQGKISTAPARSSFPYYDGVYELTPLPQLDIILDTSNKILTKNMIVKEIPYFETTNESGGYTVIIG